MANYIIIALLLYIILKDLGLFRREPKKEKIDYGKEQEIKERKEEFNNIMNYSIETAIESKRR